MTVPEKKMWADSAGGSVSVARHIAENVIIALVYWGISHIDFIVFRNIGILPMPIWPAAAVAFVAGFYRSWSAAPGIAIGTILANYISLGAPLSYAACIAVMNTVGPIVSAVLMRKRVSDQLSIRGITDVFVCFGMMAILMPLLTASGGIGSKWLLGLVPADAVVTSWFKWFIGHSLGGIVFSLPIFAWVKGRVHA